MKKFLIELNKIKVQFEPMVDLVHHWSSINSGTENLEGLKKMLLALEHSFKILGGEIKRIDLPPRHKISPQGELIAIPSGQALAISKRYPYQKSQILLSGHMDTVFSASHPFQKPERLSRDRMRGPGVTDMKGGLVVLLKAVEALETSPYAGKMGWDILISPDEEVGSVGSAPLLTQMAPQNTYGLVFEPAFSDGSFVSSRKGSFNYTLVVRGKAAHVGRDFFLGKNAVYTLARIVNRLAAVTDREKGRTMNVGNITAGDAVNVVPDLAICRFNLRVTTAEDLREAETEIEQIIASEKEEGIELKLYTDYRRGPKPFDENTQALFTRFKECADELDLIVSWRESGGVCDGNILAEAGLTTIDSLGVVGGGIHTDEEYIELNSLVERTQLTALFLMQLAADS